MRRYREQAACGSGYRADDRSGYDVKRVSIDDSCLFSEDKEVLEDLLAAAVNDAVRKVEAQNRDAMSGLCRRPEFAGRLQAAVLISGRPVMKFSPALANLIDALALPARGGAQVCPAHDAAPAGA